MLLVREIDPYERWSWHLLAPETDTEIRLRSLAPDRTLVHVTTSGRIAAAAVQTALRPRADGREPLADAPPTIPRVSSGVALLGWSSVKPFTERHA